jgi:hypothetical protein
VLHIALRSQISEIMRIQPDVPDEVSCGECSWKCDPRFTIRWTAYLLLGSECGRIPIPIAAFIHEVMQHISTQTLFRRHA